MAEWFKAHAWKVCVPSHITWVIIFILSAILFLQINKLIDGVKFMIDSNIIQNQIFKSTSSRLIAS